MAKDELELIPKYAMWREWEKVEGKVETAEFAELYPQLAEVDPMAAEQSGLAPEDNVDQVPEMQVHFETAAHAEAKAAAAAAAAAAAEAEGSGRS